MHEMSLINDLVSKIEAIAKKNKAKRIVKVTAWLGAMSHISADHFRGHFEDGTRGTIAHGAKLEVETSADMNDPNAQSILLKSVEVEDA